MQERYELSNFITTFHYTKYHQVNGNQVPLDQDLESDPDKISP